MQFSTGTKQSKNRTHKHGRINKWIASIFLSPFKLLNRSIPIWFILVSFPVYKTNNIIDWMDQSKCNAVNIPIGSISVDKFDFSLVPSSHIRLNQTWTFCIFIRTWWSLATESLSFLNNSRTLKGLEWNKNSKWDFHGTVGNVAHDGNRTRWHWGW